MSNPSKLWCHGLLLERDGGMMSGRDRGRGGDLGPDKTDSDWRARPSADDGPRKDDDYGESMSLQSFLLVYIAILHFSYCSCDPVTR